MNEKKECPFKYELLRHNKAYDIGCKIKYYEKYTACKINDFECIGEDKCPIYSK